MKIAGKSNTKSNQSLPLSPPPTKNSNEFWEFVKECIEHIKKNRVRWFFGLILFILGWSVKTAYNKVSSLEKKYHELDKKLAVLEEGSKEVKDIKKKSDDKFRVVECKNGVLLECYNKCNLQEILRRQNACEATK